MDDMKISTIMPVRNGEAYIAAALNSILFQEIDVAEILVIDDGSNDGSRQIVEQFRAQGAPITLLDGPQKGPGPARNIGLKAATGDVISFLDCDDLWPENKLSLQIGRLHQDKPAKVVSGFVRYFDKQQDDSPAPSADGMLNELFHVHLGATVFLRDVFDEIGMFDESFLYAEDVDLSLRIRESELPMVILDEVTLFYRRHDNSMTSTYTKEEKRDFNRAVMNSLLRRRKAGRTQPLPPYSTLMERRSDG